MERGFADYRKAINARILANPDYKDAKPSEVLYWQVIDENVPLEKLQKARRTCALSTDRISIARHMMYMGKMMGAWRYEVPAILERFFDYDSFIEAYKDNFDFVCNGSELWIWEKI